MVLQLSAIVQVITMECPTALIWCSLGENRQLLNGSPLDHLPIAPSTLPMPANYDPYSIAALRQELAQMEESIRTRSKNAESRWCSDKWHNLMANNSNTKILASLDALDTHCFDKMDSSNSLELLYTKTFASVPLNVDAKDGAPPFDASQDAPIIRILCEWAVSCQRWGEHRAMAVAWLLDKRQNEIMAAQENSASGSGSGDSEKNNQDDRDSVCSGGGGGGGSYGEPVLQKILFDFLDKDAPVEEPNGSAQNRTQFKNLVHLFSELIRHDVFSHDSYMCTLIARGDLCMRAPQAMSSVSNNLIPSGPISNTKTTSPTSMNIQPPPTNSMDDEYMEKMNFKPKMEEFDDSNVDDDLDKLLQHINTDQNNSMDAPDSPKEPENSNTGTTAAGHGAGGNGAGGNGGGIGNGGANLMEVTSRHYLFAKHFPLPQESDAAASSAQQHDMNQRYILLFGVGKERDEKKHAVKKMSKEICKLFSKKFSIDVADNGRVKKHSRSEFIFEATTNKCQAMAYFDQHFVTWQCAVTVQEMLNSFSAGSSSYLPVQEHVAFLFDLMEMALNIHGLIDMCIQILKVGFD